MKTPEIIFDNTPYMRVARSRKVALRCMACGRTVVMDARECDGRECPLCGGALGTVGCVAPWPGAFHIGVDLANGSDFTVVRGRGPCADNAQEVCE